MEGITSVTSENTSVNNQSLVFSFTEEYRKTPNVM